MDRARGPGRRRCGRIAARVDAMSWAIGYDTRWSRDIGYGVPAWCDHPDCQKKIHRGLSYVCGGQPFGGDEGCGLYFCEDHHCLLCERCEKNEEPFQPKPDHTEWIEHKETDPSWEKWRTARDAVETGAYL